MNFQHSEQLKGPSTVVVDLKGVLDAGTSVELEMALAPHLRNPAIDTFILNVPELTFISSSGLRVMMIIIKNIAPKKGRLYMVGAGEQIAGLVKMSGMSKWILLRNRIDECSD